MGAADIDGIVDTIRHLPDGSEATIDLREVTSVDPSAARDLADAIDERTASGVEISVVVSLRAVRGSLRRAGVGRMVVQRRRAA